MVPVRIEERSILDWVGERLADPYLGGFWTRVFELAAWGECSPLGGTERDRLRSNAANILAGAPAPEVGAWFRAAIETVLVESNPQPAENTSADTPA